MTAQVAIDQHVLCRYSTLNEVESLHECGRATPFLEVSWPVNPVERKQLPVLKDDVVRMVAQRGYPNP